MKTNPIRLALYKEMQKRLAGVSVTEEWTPEGGVKRTTKMDDSTPGEADLLVRMLQVAPPGADGNSQQATPKAQVPVEKNQEVPPVEEVQADQAPGMQDEEDAVVVEPKDRIKASMKRKADLPVPAMNDVDFEIEAEQDESSPSDLSDPKVDEEFHRGEAEKKAEVISKMYTGPEMWAQLEHEFSGAAEELDFNEGAVTSALMEYQFNDVMDDGIPIKITSEEATDILMAGYDEDVPHKDINRRLENGDVWAWCSVHVIAKWENEEGEEFTGDDSLGGCSYESETDFKKPGGYYDDMKQVAYDALVEAVKESNMKKERTATKLAFLLPKRVDCEFKIDDPEQEEPEEDSKIDTMIALEEMDHVYERLTESLRKKFQKALPLDNSYTKENLSEDVIDALDWADAKAVSDDVGPEVAEEIAAMGSVDITPELILASVKKAISKDSREADILLANWEELARYDADMYEYFGKVTCTWTNPENEVEYTGESSVYGRGRDDYDYESKHQSHEDEAFEDMLGKIKKEIGDSGQTEMPLTAKKEKRYASNKKEVKKIAEKKNLDAVFSSGDFVQVTSGKMIEAGLEGSIGQISQVFEKGAEVEFPDPDESLGMPVVARIAFAQLKRVEEA